MQTKAQLEAELKSLKTDVDSKKLYLNGSFGKFGSPYSKLYAPNLMLTVTLTGQLALLMLIEKLELAGISAISANTDGVVIKTDKIAEADAIVKQWEKSTNYEMEKELWAALFARDVNNYASIKSNKKIKAKGVFSEYGSALNSPLSKNPEVNIVNDAIKAFLSAGTPLRDTIMACQDMRRFVSIRKATGGAHKNGVYLGKVVRWYYAKGEQGTINKMNGDAVGKTEGAKPLMELDGLEPDIDYDWYVNAAESALYDIGFYKRVEESKLL